MAAAGIVSRFKDGLITFGAIWLALTAAGILAGLLRGYSATPLLSLAVYLGLLAAYAGWTGPGRRSAGAYFLAGFLFPIVWFALLIALIGLLPPAFSDNASEMIFAGSNVGYQVQGGADTPVEAYLPLFWFNVLMPVTVVVGVRGFIRYHRPD